MSVNPHATRADEVVLDFRVYFSCNCLVSIGHSPKSKLNVRVTIKDICVHGNARVVVRPLLLTTPFAGGICFSLLDSPLIDFQGFNLGEAEVSLVLVIKCPFRSKAALVDTKLMKVGVVKVITMLLVEPNRLYIPLIHTCQIHRLLIAPPPIALCYFQVFEAQKLPPSRTIHLGRKPFCQIRVGGNYFRTKNGSSSVDPVWSESFWCPVHDYHDDFKISVYDKALLSEDDLLGLVEFKIKDIVENKKLNGLDKWLPVAQTRNCYIHFRVAVFKLTSDREKVQLCTKRDEGKSKEMMVVEQNVEEKTSQHKRDQQTSDCPHGMLSVYVHHIRPLELTEVAGRPYLQIRFSNQEAKTATTHCSEEAHRIEEHFSFKCMAANDEVVELSVVDKRRGDPLATKRIKLSDLVQQKDMTIDEDMILDGKIKYDVRIFIQFLACELDKDVAKNLRKPLRKKREYKTVEERGKDKGKRSRKQRQGRTRKP